MTEVRGPWVQVGDFFVAPIKGTERVWLERAEGPGAGEGGMFDVKQLQEVIRKFYEENF